MDPVFAVALTQPYLSRALPLSFRKQSERVAARQRIDELRAVVTAPAPQADFKLVT